MDWAARKTRGWRGYTLEQQLEDYQHGTRDTAKPIRISATLMIKNSKKMTDGEI
jgi:hypothetical protein